MIRTLVLPAIHPRREETSPALGVGSWWISAAIYTSILAPSATISVIILGMVTFAALKDYFSMSPLRWADRPLVLLAYLLVPIQFYFAADGWNAASLLFVPIFILCLVSFWLIRQKQSGGFRLFPTIYAWGVITIVWGVSHLAYGSLWISEIQAELFVYMALLLQINRWVQRYADRLLEQFRFSPDRWLTPTVEGVAISALVTLIAAMSLAPLFVPVSLQVATVMALIVSSCGPAAAFVLALLRAKSELDEADAWLPGFGGILARVYPLALAAPLCYYLLGLFQG